MSANILGPSVGYVDMLNEETRASQEREATEGKKWHPLRPSSLGKCTRELYYEYMEYTGKASYPKELKTPDTVRLLDLGNHIERHLIQQFERNCKGVIEMKYKQQVLTFFRLEAKNDPALSHLVEGSLDTCFWSQGSRGVVDFKSKKDKYSSYFSSNWDETSGKLSRMSTVTKMSEECFWVENLEAFLNELRDTFFEMNFVQLNGYACTDFLRERGVDHASIIQSNKNDSRIREIRFKPSIALFEKCRAKLQSVVDAVDQGDIELAPRSHLLGSLKCRFCPYSQECWNGKDAKKAFFNTLPPKKWPKDTSRMKQGRRLEQLLEEYESLAATGAKQDAVEESILKVLTEENEGKIRTEAGAVYEAKLLKSPSPHLELRRSKA